MMATVAPVGLTELGHALEMAVDARAHPPFQQPGERLAGGAAVVLAPFDPFGLHGLHHLERNG